MLKTFAWSSYPEYVKAKAEVDWICYDLCKEFGPSPAVLVSGRSRGYHASTNHQGV